MDEKLKNIDPDIQDFIYKKGQKSVEHNQPSAETLKMIGDLREHNAEMFGMIKSIHETIHGDFGIMVILKEIKQTTADELAQIKSHTGKTNGRVGALENWKAGLVVGMTILTFAVPSITWWFINKFDDLRIQVTQHIAQDTRNFEKLK